jgi:hypothetical protein
MGGGCLAAVGRLEPALRFRRCGRVSSPQHNWTSEWTAPTPDAPPVVPPGAAPMSPAWRDVCGRGVSSPLLHSGYRRGFYISRPTPRADGEPPHRGGASARRRAAPGDAPAPAGQAGLGGAGSRERRPAAWQRQRCLVRPGEVSSPPRERSGRARGGSVARHGRPARP